MKVYCGHKMWSSERRADAFRFALHLPLNSTPVPRGLYQPTLRASLQRGTSRAVIPTIYVSRKDLGCVTDWMWRWSNDGISVCGSGRFPLPNTDLHLINLKSLRPPTDSLSFDAYWIWKQEGKTANPGKFKSRLHFSLLVSQTPVIWSSCAWCVVNISAAHSRRCRLVSLG